MIKMLIISAIQLNLSLTTSIFLSHFGKWDQRAYTEFGRFYRPRTSREHRRLQDRSQRGHPDLHQCGETDRRAHRAKHVHPQVCPCSSPHAAQLSPSPPTPSKAGAPPGMASTKRHTHLPEQPHLLGQTTPTLLFHHLKAASRKTAPAYQPVQSVLWKDRGTTRVRKKRTTHQIL